MVHPPAIVLCDFQDQRPEYDADQESILEWIAAAHAQVELNTNESCSTEQREAIVRRFHKLVMRFGCSTDRIRRRASALSDFTHRDWDNMTIFRLNQSPAGLPCGDRSRFYREVCNRAFERFYPSDEKPPVAMIHVTCTGYVSPSGAQHVVAKHQWGRTTEVLHAYHMGCYASLPAIRLAAGLVACGKPNVDIVHTELCALHMDPSQHLPEHLVMQTLFSDGMIRYKVVADSSDSRLSNGLQVIGTHEEIIPDSESEMSWMVSDFGMQMTLSRKVPERIRAILGSFVGRLAEVCGHTPAELCTKAIFAIHPGGPRIIDEIADHLHLRPDQVAASNAILRDHGNMSSSTLPHVWQAIVNDSAVAHGTFIVALAFGPGLTISGALLRKLG